MQLKDVRVASSGSTVNGGFLYASEPLGTQTVDVRVIMTKASSAVADYGSIQSLGDGGVFFLDGIRTKLSITGLGSASKLKIDSVKSNTNGGLIFSKALLGVTVRDVVLTNCEASLDGGVMHLDENQPVLVERVDASNFRSGTNGGFINALKASAIDIKDSNLLVGGSTLGKGGILYISPAANALTTMKFDHVIAS